MFDVIADANKDVLHGLKPFGALIQKLRILREELKTVMALVGKRSIAELDSTVLWRY
jgi:isopentenyl diphosphate isomerase/L-lactate dehydrogenase-like FMN-dependent dehydrogenase